jgi:hypothetical protein
MKNTVTVVPADRGGWAVYIAKPFGVPEMIVVSSFEELTRLLHWECDPSAKVGDKVDVSIQDKALPRNP